MMIVHMNDKYEKKAVREMIRMHLNRIQPVWRQAKKGEIADTVIMAAGIKPRTDVVDLFKANFNNVLVAGDARKGGRIATAIREGFETGWIF